MSDPILQLDNLSIHFPVQQGWQRRILKAVDDVSFTVAPGEVLGIVGESGCGKSTLARGVLRLVEPANGRIVWLGDDVTGLTAGRLRARRDKVQIIFQDPLASLDPRMTIGACIAEPLKTLGRGLKAAEIRERTEQIMEKVGLSPALRNRYPHEFSGGQAQRVGIARALITEPKLLICDEPVSALDVSIQGQILNLLKDIRSEMNISLIFISHDLSVVRHICDRVIVLYLGKIMEMGDCDAMFRSPHHPYTKALLQAIPVPDPDKERRLRGLPGDVPSPLDPPSGCVFRTRCPKADTLCADTEPALEEKAPDYFAACHFPEN